MTNGTLHVAAGQGQALDRGPRGRRRGRSLIVSEGLEVEYSGSSDRKK